MDDEPESPEPTCIGGILEWLFDLGDERPICRLPYADGLVVGLSAELQSDWNRQGSRNC